MIENERFLQMSGVDPGKRSATLLAASYDFGSRSFTFETADEEWLELLDRRYHAFADSPRAADFTVRFEPAGRPRPDDLVSPLAVRLEALVADRTESGLRVSSETTTCDIDWASRTALLRGPRAMYPLDNLLRHLLPLLWNEGVLVHAAFLARAGGGGILAGGPSGAGKSTLARLAGSNALCDELAAVRVGTGKPGGCELIALPFWAARPGRAPLDALVFLSHSDSREHRIRPLNAERTLRRLVPLVLWPVWDEGAMATAFLRLTELAESTPAFDLAFVPRADVWELLEKEVP